MNHLKYTISICLVLCTYLQGQDSLHHKVKFDTNYVRHYPDYLSIALFTKLPTIDIQINNKTQNDKINRFKSNITNVIGFDLDYKGISLVLGFRGKNDISASATKGKTSYRFLGIKMHRHKFYADISYIRSTSFYDENSYLKFPGSSPNHPYIIRPNLDYTKASITFLYNLNHNRYSYLAPLTYTERQVKSKGGWLIAGGLYYNRLTDNQFIIKPNDQTLQDNDSLNKRLDTYFIKFGIGRGMNLIVFKRVFFNLQAIGYGNIAYVNTYNNNKDKNTISPNLFFELSSALGYNSKRFFMGLRVAADRNAVKKNKFKYINTTGYAQIHIGYRFNSPKWLDKSYEYLKSKIIG